VPTHPSLGYAKSSLAIDRRRPRRPALSTKTECPVLRGEDSALKKTLLPLAVLTATALAPFLATTQAHAWGHSGHAITALVAMDHLTPVAAQNVKAILGKDTMADVASWADDYKQDHRETAGWHFTDIPGSADRYDRNRDCPAPPLNPNAAVRDCSLDRIIYFENQLRNPALPQDQKLFDLKMLIHLMGDLHQPFHNIADARGGNNITVIEFGATSCDGWPCNLHATWDDGLIEHRGLSDKKYAATLETEIPQNGWDKEATVGNLVHWANQAHAYAQDAWVPNGTLINQAYYNKNIKIVDEQLALGGLRLANALNDIFTTPPPAPAK